MLLFQDDLAGAEREFAGLHQRGRERGDQSAVASLALSRGLVALYAGEWAAAEQLAGESHDAAIQTRQGHAAASALGLLSYLHANRGDVERARIEATEAERLSEPMPRGVYFSQVLPMWALATLSLLDGDASSAAERLAPLHARAAAAGLADPGRLDFVPDLVEALVSLGRADEAEALLDDYERRAQEFGRTWAILGAARCRAMLALTRGDPPAAVSVLEPVVDKLPVLGRRFERGRALLVLGPARRHAMQKRGARDALDQALVIFDELGARGWADRTRAERGRISGRAPASGGLTPAEQRVAALVAEGRTNREVAAALFVTEHTVESHLRNVFRKMRVRSRAQLARRFAEPERDPAS
jgi:DNA-binding CsgD family transcriptional regulator